MANPQEQYVVKPEHDILHVSLSGSWSADTTHSYVAEYKQVVSRYFAREWAIALDLRELEMLVSEDFQIQSFIALNTWSFIKGLHAMAIIVDSDNRDHLLYQFEEIIASSPSFKTNVFARPEEARDWLNAEGFKGREQFTQHSQALTG